MATIIKRAGKVIISILLPVILLTILIYSAYLLTQAKAEQYKPSIAEKEQPKLSVAKQELLKQKPVWTENTSQRNSNDRVWEITKWQEEIDPETNEPNVVEVKSLVREKGCGICYQDSNDSWQITDASWRQTKDGFVMDKANYALDMGNTADSLLYYDIDGETLALKADSIKIYDGKNTLPFASVNKAEGYIDPNDKGKLIYPNAFGKGIDLEIQAAPDGFHQNVVFKSKLNLPAGVQRDKSKVFLYTELGLDSYLDNSKRQGRALQMSFDEKDKTKGKSIRKKIGRDEISGLAVNKFSKSNIDFVVEKGGKSSTAHSFVDSQILQHGEKGGLKNLAIAEKQVIRDNNKTYLVESLDCSKMDEAAYPVVWDYHNISSAITTYERWYADATYYLSGSIQIASGGTLEIEPGTIVKLRKGSSYPTRLCAYGGTLIAKGEPYSYIVFTSARDPNMGEIIDTNSVGIGDWGSLEMEGTSSIEFCKVGYSKNGIQAQDFDSQGEISIKNNIVYNSQYRGIYAYKEDASEVNVTIFNNLVDNAPYGIVFEYYLPNDNFDLDFIIANNTVKATNGGISVDNYGDTPMIIKNNIIQGANIGIYLDEYASGPYTEYNNAFYQCTTLVDGNTPHVSDVNLAVSPFNSTNTYLGKYFLNTDPCGGARLVNAGSGNVAELYDEPNDWSIYTVSDSNHFINTATTFTTDKTWQPNYNTCDTGIVAIGYHHPRVDYLLRTDVTVSSGKILTIKPGTTVAMGGGSSYYGNLNIAGKLVAEGKPFDGGYINFIQSNLASANWNVVKYALTTNPYVYLQSTADAGSLVNFSKIYNLAGLKTYKVLSKPVHDDTFKFNYYGILFSASGSNLGIKNNLFINNYYGIYKSGSYAFLLQNNTFDRNIYRGLYCSGNYGDVKNCIFADTNSTSPTPAYGIQMSSTSYSLTEAYNAFYNNTKHYMKSSTEQALASTDFAGEPNRASATVIRSDDFYTNWDDFEDRFCLPQDSNLVDSGNPSYGQMWGYTTDPNSSNPIIDVNRLDIGYHYPTDTQTDTDGLYDYEEYWLGTNPNDNDSDNDGIDDGWEVQYGLNPLVDDADLDKDGDGMPNIWEYTYGFNPTINDSGDNADGDDYTNLSEYLHGSDPIDPNSIPTAATTIFVPVGATTIQLAIDCSINGDVIVVALGTYHENLDFNGRAITLTGTDPNNWAIVGLTTIFASDSNVATVSFNESENSSSTITGFKISGGLHGIECDAASPVIKNCIITGNGQSTGSGGGICSSNSVSPLITNCFIVGNKAENGAGIYNYNSNANIRNCVISNNNALGYGGGIYSTNSSPQIVNCTITNNDADNGGGMCNYGPSSNPEVMNCIFWGNAAVAEGNEIYNTSGGSAVCSYCDIKDSINGEVWDTALGVNNYGNIDIYPNFTVPVYTGSGSGTQSDPYAITDVYQLQAMANDLDAYYILGNDIDASETSTWNSGAGFVPVGNSTVPFSGQFDGKGHVITGLFLNRINNLEQGLFGRVTGGVIKNVQILDATVSGDIYIAVLSGYTNGGTSIENCYVSGTLTLKSGSTGSESGGLTGCVGTRCFIRKCGSAVNVNASSRQQVGSLVGYLCGRGSTSPITRAENCFASGTVTGSGAKQGNLVGDADGSQVDSCYSCGNYKALIGYNYGSPVITNSYWDSTKGAALSSYGGTPKTTAQMKQQTTFANWDFDMIWSIEENQTYPYFGYLYDITGRYAYQIDTNSPCVNAGQPDYSYGGYDIDNRPRVVCRVDIGAYEANMPDADLDYDGDGLINVEECENGTDPCDVDSDDDELNDYAEVKTYNTNPLNSDTDGDGMPDGWEVQYGLNPLVNDVSSDADSDGLTNLQEYQNGTNPNDGDTDNDGMPDGYEARCGLLPIDPNDASNDADSDGYSNFREFLHNSEANDVNSLPFISTLNVPQPCSSIQIAIDLSIDGDQILVQQGEYYENIDFKGKAITVKSTYLSDAGAIADTIIRPNDFNLPTVQFSSAEDDNSVLAGFTIADGSMGVYCNVQASPIISNCVIVSNSDVGIVGGSPSVINCTLVYNGNYGVCYTSGLIKNSVIWGNGHVVLSNSSAIYSCVEDISSGQGNISFYPYFSDANNGDYRLMSYSPCIDAGDPNSDYSNEPNGSYGIDLGAYGNTNEATLASDDNDVDGLPDTWELLNWPQIDVNDANDDFDRDSLTNIVEYQIGLDANNIDTDNDGMPDGWEIEYNLNPKINDSDSDLDNDGIPNVWEYTYGLNPQVDDSAGDIDGDGMTSIWEHTQGLNPNDPNDAGNDLDSDVYSNICEFIHGSNPNDINDLPQNMIITVPTRTAKIQNAVDWSINGDTVMVSPGTYYESINFDGKAITLAGTDHNNWDIVEATVIDANNTGNAITCDVNSVLRGLTIRDSNAYGLYCSNANPTIERCIIKNNNNGVYFSNSEAILKNNKIFDNTNSGIIYVTDEHLAIQNNWIYFNNIGITCGSGSSSSVMITNNTIVSNDNYGIWVASGSEAPTIKNCIVWDNNDDLFDCNTTYSCIQDGDSGTGNISSDPYFVNVDSNDFHLRMESLCINTGDPNFSDSNSVDIDGQVRTRGPRVDIGADESPMIYYVDADANGVETGYSWQDAFTSIQSGINAAVDGDVVEVNEGIYYESIDVNNKAITIKSLNPDDSAVVIATIIDANTADVNAVEFFSAGNVSGSILTGFTIKGGFSGIVCNNYSKPSISKCVIKENKYGIKGLSSFANIANCIIAKNEILGVEVSYFTINNCTIADNNSYGVNGYANKINNCIIWGNDTDLNGCVAEYSCISGGDSGQGNINYQPYFIDTNSSDYHLLSYSPCIDAGDPCSDSLNEPNLGGGRINMGAYGNTLEAELACDDNDIDGLPDAWELLYWPSIDINDANDDYDTDNLINLFEYQMGLEPNNADTDNDGLADGNEVNVYHTNPLISDTDNDGMSDGSEVQYGLDPLVNDANLDADNDGVPNIWEYSHGLDPADTNDANGDKDGDGMLNIWEYQHGLNPIDANDASGDLDNDTYSNICEFIHGSNPNDTNSLPQNMTITVPAMTVKIQDAVNWSINGDTVQVLPGTYHEDINFHGKGVVLRGVDPNNWETVENTIIHGSGVTSTIEFGYGPSYHPLIGLTITGGLRGIYCGSSAMGNIDRCIVTGNSDIGIQISGCNNVVISNCRISSNGNTGVALSACIAVVSNCCINNNSDKGILMGQATVAFKNNILHGNNIGVNIDNYVYFTASNCTIVNNESHGITKISDYSNAVISNCIVWDNNDDLHGCTATYSCIQDGDAGVGNISSDPCFVDIDANNFHLKIESLCINSGNPNFTVSNYLDIDGQVRIRGQYVDMGADESPIKWYVDADANGLGDGSSWQDAFTYIQDGIDAAIDGDIVEVNEGIYYESIDFDGKAITVTGLETKLGNTIIDANNDEAVAVKFNSAEDSNSSLMMITVTGGGIGIDCNNSSPTIQNCVIKETANYGVAYGSPRILSCTIVDNFDVGIYSCLGEIRNNIIWGNLDDLYNCSSEYSCVKNGDEGTGNIYFYPYFADAPNGDYHLMSYSPCINAGDPCSTYLNEPNNGGGRIDIGAYGNTSEATLVSSDNDTDGLPDALELLSWSQVDVNDANDDYDRDDLTNIVEYHIGTDPNNIDTDGDGLSDGAEINLHGLNPLNADTDSDGMPDGWEVVHNLNPNDDTDASPDSDNDGLTNAQEYAAGTNPNSLDSDNDGMPDGWEFLKGFNPKDANDAAMDLDNDGYSNVMEHLHASDPNNDSNMPQNVIITVPKYAKTIQSAINWSIDGDEIVVLRGRYYESINFKGKAVTLRSEDVNDWATVASTIIDGNNNAANVVTFNSGEGANSVITGFSIISAVSYGVVCGEPNTPCSPTISKCFIEDNGSYGVYCVSGSPAIINNKIGFNGGNGICSFASVSPTVKNNFIYNNAGGGIQFSSSISSSEIRNNTIAYNTGYGIYVSSGDEPNISNCIVWENSDDLVDCNAVYSCIQNGDAGLGNINDNPKFIYIDAQTPANNDYRLLRTSSCINAGDPNNNYNGESDIEGQARQANRVDIGADEVCEVHNTTKNIWYSLKDSQGIQTAIDEANEFDTIEVYEWVFYETIDFNGVNVTLTSPYYTDWQRVESTVIDANDPNLNVITFSSGEDSNSVIRGITLTGGNRGVYCVNYSSPVIRSCIITDNNSHGIYCTSGSPLINANKIYSNKEDGIYSSSAIPPVVVFNWIYSNDNGIKVTNSNSQLRAINNTVAYNKSYGIYHESGMAPFVNSCIVWGHDSNDLFDCNAAYSCIQDVNDANGTANSLAEPQFQDADANNFHLKPISPYLEGADHSFSRDGWVDIDSGIPHTGPGGDCVDVYYVDRSAKGLGTGLSWANAFTTLEAALAKCRITIPQIDQIWVASGTYTPSAPTGRDATFALVPGVAIYGGFPVGGGDETAYNPKAWPTILSGDRGVQGTCTDNCYHVVTGADGAILDGFIIEGGHANGVLSNDQHGGGMYTSGYSALRIDECTFRNNYAKRNGGAIANEGVNVNLILSNCILQNNFSTGEGNGGGGAMYNYFSTPVIINCFFVENESSYLAGALYNLGFTAGSKINNCVFSKNKAIGGGAICNQTIVLPERFVVNGSTFSGNIATIGNAIFNWHSYRHITNCIFWGDSTNQIYDPTPYYGSITYCDVKGGYSGTGNKNEDPLFVNPPNPAGDDGIYGTADDGLVLKSSPVSPCRNTGSNAAVPADITTDITGSNRIKSTTVDIGAYEGSQIPVASNGSTSLIKGHIAYVIMDATDEEGDVLSYSISQYPSHGYVTVNGNVATYMPLPIYSGSDSFTFVANDGSYDSNPAIVTIDVQSDPQVSEWGSAPYVIDGTSSVTMTAAVASSISGEVECYFECISGNGHSSGWQTSSTYTDIGASGTCIYRVSMRLKNNTQIQSTGTQTKTVTVNYTTTNKLGITEPVSGELGNDLANFDVDLFTGKAGYTVPIVVPPARNGSEPSLALSYSGGDNGWCGVGWGLGVGSIQRNTKDGVPVKISNGKFSDEYDDGKGFYANFKGINSKLIKISSTTNNGIVYDIYRAEVDKSNALYEFKYVKGTNCYWEVTDKSGNKYYFGKLPSSTDMNSVLINSNFNNTNGKNIFSWSLDSTQSINGDLTWYQYTKDQGQLYLSLIKYNGNVNDSTINDWSEAPCSVVFTLDNRTDKTFSYSTGFRVETNKRLKEITTKIGTSNVRRYSLNYGAYSSSTLRSLLRSVTEYRYGDGAISGGQPMPPITFEYQTKDMEFEEPVSWGIQHPSDKSTSIPYNSPYAMSDYGSCIGTMMDINGDSLPDRIIRAVEATWTNITTDKFESNMGSYTASGATRRTSNLPLNFLNGAMQINTNVSTSQYFEHTKSYSAAGKRTIRVDFGFIFENVLVGKGFTVQYHNGSGWQDVKVFRVGPDYSNGELKHGSICISDVDGFAIPVSTKIRFKGDIGNAGSAPGYCIIDDIYVDYSLSPAGDYFWVQLNKGNGFKDISYWGPVISVDDTPTYRISQYMRQSDGYGHTNADMFDLNGDGFPDRVVKAPNSQYNVVSNGIGKGPSTDFGTNNSSTIYTKNGANWVNDPADNTKLLKQCYAEIPSGTNIVLTTGFDAKTPGYKQLRITFWVHGGSSSGVAININGTTVDDDVNFKDDDYNNTWNSTYDRRVFTQNIFYVNEEDIVGGFTTATKIKFIAKYSTVYIDNISVDATTTPEGLGFRVQKNNGSGFNAIGNWGPLKFENQEQQELTGWCRINGVNNEYTDYTSVFQSMLDINGDGLPDRVLRKYDGDFLTAVSCFMVQFNTGNGLSSDLVKWDNVKSEKNYVSYHSIHNTTKTYNNESVLMLDLNGDGLPDRVMVDYGLNDKVFRVQFNNGHGFENSIRSWGPLYIKPGSSTLAWYYARSSTEGTYGGDAEVDMLDINGDGLLDRVMWSGGTTSAFNYLEIQLNTGSTFENVGGSTPSVKPFTNVHGDSAHYSNIWNRSSAVTGASDSGQSALITMIDINGDGLADRVMRDPDGYGGGTFNEFKVQLNKGPLPDMLKKVNGSLGGSVEIEYDRSNSPANYDKHKDSAGINRLPFPVYVVSKVTFSDGSGGKIAKKYDYSRGFNDPQRREFGGFGKVEVKEVDATANTDIGTKTITYYHQGGGYDDTANGEYQDAVTGAFAKRGMVYRTELYGWNTSAYRLYSETINKVQFAQPWVGKACYYPYVLRTIQMDYPKSGTCRAKAKDYTYESSTGNIKIESDFGEVTQPITRSNYSWTSNNTADDVYTHTAYQTFTNTCIIDKIASVKVTSDSTGNNKLKETKYLYDESPSPATRGNVTTVQQWLDKNIDASENRYVISKMQYDAYGNLRVSISPPCTTGATAGNPVSCVTTTIEYDATYKTFPVRTMTGKGAISSFLFTSQSNKFISHARYDVRTGLPTKQMTTTDSAAAMGILNETTYDAMFRPYQKYTSVKPVSTSCLDASWTTDKLKCAQITYGSFGSVGNNYVRQESSKFVSYTYNDGLGRVVQTRVLTESTAGANKYRAVNIEYNNRGNRCKETRPYFSTDLGYKTTDTPADTSKTITTYDPIGRVKEMNPPDGEAGSLTDKTKVDYEDGGLVWVTVTTDAENKIKKQRHNARGQVIELDEQLGAGWVVTTFDYDLVGRCIKIIDNSANQILYDYDSLDRKIKMTDPDMGIWKYYYWDDGKPKKQLDAKYQRIEPDYTDEIGRLHATRTYPAATGTIPEHTYIYTYDTGETGYNLYKGLLFKVEEWQGESGTGTLKGSVRTGYDTRLRAVKTTRYIAENGKSYTTEAAFDDADRLIQTVYPEGLAVIGYNYDTAGHLVQATSVYGAGTGTTTFYDVTPWGFDVLDRPEGVKYGNNVNTDYEYYSGSQRRKKIRSYTASSDVMNLSYTYDKMSNMKSITDGKYSGSASNTFSGILYDDLYRLTYLNSTSMGAKNYSYNSIGNLTSNGEWASGTYSYPNSGATSVRPYAVTSANSKNYGYDGCGNMTSRMFNSTAQTLKYDAENRLISVEFGSTKVEFGYSYTGERLYKKNNGNISQLWIGDIYEEKDGKKLCHVIVDDGLVCTFEPQPATASIFWYYQNDHLGSSSVITDRSGVVVKQYGYKAYGDDRYHTGAGMELSNRFTGQVLDEDTGLYYYGARFYDARLGRFIQPDSVIPDDPTANSQALNRYSYAFNNPLKFTDPTGNTPVWDAKEQQKMQAEADAVRTIRKNLSASDTSNSSAASSPKNSSSSIQGAGTIDPGSNGGSGSTCKAHAAQLIANTAQGVQDTVIGSVNLITGSVGSMGMYGEPLGWHNVIPAIPSPQWAKDRYVKQSNFVYNAEKIVTSFAVGCGVMKLVSMATVSESVIVRNAAQGAAWEQKVGARLQDTQTNVVGQITVRVQSGVRTRLDFIGNDASTGAIGLTEAKSSVTASLTGNQSLAFPEIQQSGAVVVGAGKSPFVGGTVIPPTKVNVIRP